MADERMGDDDRDHLLLDLGVAVLLSSTDDGLSQRASGACTARVNGAVRPPEIQVDWPASSLHLDTRPGNCLLIDLADFTIVIYSTIDSDCAVIRFDSEHFHDDAFEVFMNIASEYCTFVSREQAAQNDILSALGSSPEMLLAPATPQSDQDLSPVLPSRIDSGAAMIVSGIQRCSSIICDSLTLGSEFIQRQIEPAPNPMPIHPRIRDGFRAVGSAANVVATGMTSMGENISSSLFSGNDNAEGTQRPVVAQVVRSSIRGVARVALASTDASLSIFQTALGAASGVLARKYGDGLGEILQDGTRVLYSMRLASRALRRVCLQLLMDGFREEPNPYAME